MTTTNGNNRRPVLHDPLLYGPAVSGNDGVPRPPRGRHTSKHPALSARILATGLATTGTLGLTAGYALSAHGSTTDTTVPPAATFPPAVAVPAGQAPAPSTPVNTTPSAPSSAVAAPAPMATVAPPVVELSIPDLVPANPGASAGTVGDGWQSPSNQQSSGSN